MIKVEEYLKNVDMAGVAQYLAEVEFVPEDGHSPTFLGKRLRNSPTVREVAVTEKWLM